jgi:hypothetical protein
MMTVHKVLVLGAVITALAGCSTINSLTGQTDNTVLPGQREDAIPGRAQFPDQPDPGVSKSAGHQMPEQTDMASTTAADAACKPDDATCQPPADSGSGDVFSDPQ